MTIHDKHTFVFKLEIYHTRTEIYPPDDTTAILSTSHSKPPIR